MFQSENSKNDKSRISNTSSLTLNNHQLTHAPNNQPSKNKSKRYTSNNKQKTASKQKTKSQKQKTKNPYLCATGASKRNSSNKKKPTSHLSPALNTISVFKNINMKLDFPCAPVLKFKQKKPLSIGSSTQPLKLSHQFHKKAQNRKDDFCIQYDEPLETDFSFTANSKKPYKHRPQEKFLRQSLKKAQTKNISRSMIVNSDVNDPLFEEVVVLLFKELDHQKTGVLDCEDIRQKQIPEPALYFLGGIFQKIRQAHQTGAGWSPSLQEFMNECKKVYRKSSKEDILWFVKEMIMPFKENQSGQKQNLQKSTSISHSPKLEKVQESKKSLQTSPRNQIYSSQNSFMLRESKIEQKIEIPSSDSARDDAQRSCQAQTSQKRGSGWENNNFSFDHDSSIISFRRNSHRSSHHGGEAKTEDSFYRPHPQHQSFGTEDSRQSAQFAVQLSTDREATKYESKPRSSKIIDCSEPSLHQPLAEITNFIDTQRSNTSDAIRQEANKVGAIQKAGFNRPEDLRDQIYAKLDKMKVFSDEMSLRKPINEKPVTVILKKSAAKSPLKVSKDHSEAIQRVKFIDDHSGGKDSRPQVWETQNKKLEQSYLNLKFLQGQFQNHRQIIEQRQQQRNNKIKEAIEKASRGLGASCPQKSFLNDGSKIVCALRTSTVHRFDCENEDRPLQQSSYQKNSEVLASSLGLRNSLRKGFEETKKSELNFMPLKCHASKSVISQSGTDPSGPKQNSTKKASSLSASAKVDKIDQLSNRIEEYLKKNAEKISISKQVTKSGVYSGIGKDFSKPLELQS